MLANLNDSLQERRLDSQYVTMLFALWDDDARTLTVANSGAVQPIICRGGKSTTVRVEGFPLGMFPSSLYDEQVLATEPGDAVVFVSDGILDAENAQGEMYGEDRLAKTLCSLRSRPAGEIAEAILQDVSRFQSGKERFDDETIIVLRVR